LKLGASFKAVLEVRVELLLLGLPLGELSPQDVQLDLGCDGGLTEAIVLEAQGLCLALASSP